MTCAGQQQQTSNNSKIPTITLDDDSDTDSPAQTTLAPLFQKKRKRTLSTNDFNSLQQPQPTIHSLSSDSPAKVISCRLLQLVLHAVELVR